MVTNTSPVRLTARLDDEPSRWLWLVKWLLLVPHLIVLFFLWVAFPVVTFVALVAILFTGRYPRPLFDFNLGVMRWTWRVWCYGYGALATDRYPPFSLQEEPDYPATLDVTYPEHLSRGLVLVKWWLLAIPHYLVIAFFTGGGGYAQWQWGDRWVGFDGGLVALLSVFAGVALLFTGRYPRGIFDLVIGMNRWVLRVAAYAALMTDEYPPFRLGLGGPDAATHAEPEPEKPETRPAGWSPARTAGVVVGVLLLLAGVGAAGSGGGLLWLDSHRDSSGYVTTPTELYADDGYALRFDAEDLAPVDRDWPWIGDILGDVRIEVSTSDNRPVFAGIARTADVASYLDGVPHRRYHDYRNYQHMAVAGSMPRVRPPDMPADMDIWVDSASGTGTMTLDWTPRPGDWSLVVMNSDAQQDVRADLAFAATAPALPPVAIVALGTGVVLLLGGAVLIALAARPRRHP
ncbi:DUF4389 domain-containing protein [Actinophytocola sp.]|uniref:DUF4389 domain-containing protein n=1 Tax=Actinophytocola sp. TaxID=1872138 RepID=UPI002ECFDED7